jgi:hypothetical protein
MDLRATLKALKFGLLTYPQLRDNGALASNTYFDTQGLSALLIHVGVEVGQVGLGDDDCDMMPFIVIQVFFDVEIAAIGRDADPQPSFFKSLQQKEAFLSVIPAKYVFSRAKYHCVAGVPPASCCHIRVNLCKSVSEEIRTDLEEIKTLLTPDQDGLARELLLGELDDPALPPAGNMAEQIERIKQAFSQ